MTKLHRTNLARMEGHIDPGRLQDLRKRYRAGRPMRHVIRPLLMAIMLTALMVGLLSVVVEVSEDSRWFGLTFLLFFIALEAIYTTNWLNHPRQLPLARSTYRAAELLLLILVVRIASWIIFGEGIPDTDELLEFVRAPQTLFLNGRFLISVFLVAIIWRLAILLSQTFNHLQISEFELQFHSLPLAQRKARVDDQPIQIGRKGFVESFTRFWLLGGLLLVAAVGFSTLEQQSVDTLMAPLASGRANLEPRLLGALLLFFIIGLWLLSQARLMQVHAHWLLNNVDTDENARQNWQRNSLFILVLVVLVAAFLPIGSTSALSQIVNIALFWILALANFIIFLLVLPIAMLLALLSGKGLEEVTPPPRLEQPPTMPPMESGSSALADTISMVLSSGFWAVLIVFIALALLFYFRERRQAAEGLSSALSLRDQILAWLREIWARLRGQVRSLQETLILLRETEDDADQPQAARSSRWRFLRLSSLSPRNQLRYFYLSTVRRAGDRGVKRPSSGTPTEYSEDLIQNWPEAEEGLEDLTDAFLRARYSDKEISEEDIPPVKGIWKAVRRELSQKPEAAKSDDENGSEEAL